MAIEIDIVGQLNQASFRGVEFLVPQETAARGQKVAIHEYPNSDERYAEPLGKLPPVIDLVCIVHGEFFFQNREALEVALETPGNGELVHPIYGSIQVQPGLFTVTSNQRRIGEFIFNAKFYTSKISTPVKSPATAESATFLADDARSELFDALEEEYESPFDSLGLTSIVDTILAIMNGITDAIDDVVGPIQSFVASTKSAINKFRNSVYKIMETATSLKASLEDVYNNFVQLSLDAETLADAWNSLIGYESDEEDQPDNTASRANRSNNTKAVAEQTRLIGLIGLMEATANTDYNTTEDLQSALDLIEVNYNNLMITDPGDLALNPATRAAIIKLRYTVKTVLDNQIGKIWRVADIDPGRTSISLVTYRYYGALDNVDSMIGLNPDINIANFNEQIKALTE